MPAMSLLRFVRFRVRFGEAIAANEYVQASETADLSKGLCAFRTKIRLSLGVSASCGGGGTPLAFPGGVQRGRDQGGEQRGGGTSCTRSHRSKRPGPKGAQDRSDRLRLERGDRRRLDGA